MQFFLFSTFPSISVLPTDSQMLIVTPTTRKLSIVASPLILSFAAYRLTRTFTATTTTNTTMSALTHDALKDLRDFWFDGCPQTNNAPPEAAGAVMKRWFGGDKDVDHHCRCALYLPSYAVLPFTCDIPRSRFSDLLKATEPLSVSALHSFALSSDSPQESALGLMVLLDQMPRNMFRGPETRRVHQEFDPKALALCKMFIAAQDGFDRRSNWQHFHYRSFFYLPRTPLLLQSGVR